jgi:hypothetical protein
MADRKDVLVRKTASFTRKKALASTQMHILGSLRAIEILEELPD